MCLGDYVMCFAGYEVIYMFEVFIHVVTIFVTWSGCGTLLYGHLVSRLTRVGYAKHN
jgi:hypothetical protein